MLSNTWITIEILKKKKNKQTNKQQANVNSYRKREKQPEMRIDVELCLTMVSNTQPII